MKLQDKLNDCGCLVAVQSFEETVTAIFERDYPNQTDDWLRSRPRKAVRYCRIVRESIGCKVPDEVILETLINLRKHSKLKRRTDRN